MSSGVKSVGIIGVVGSRVPCSVGYKCRSA
jgi:hypothetical protein